MGALEASRGDEKRSLEVGSESLIATEAATEILKAVTHRPRPEGDSHASFPSGHASFSFSAATFLARRIDAINDGPGRKLGYLLYAPATFVAIDRVEAGRHWPSDVVFGAFLGMFFTNEVYNAHYGDTKVERPSIFAGKLEGVWRLGPAVLGGDPGIELSFSF